MSPEDTEDLSPLPSGAQPSGRRGGISAEPVSEEEATSYVKKVAYISYFMVTFFLVDVVRVHLN